MTALSAYRDAFEQLVAGLPEPQHHRRRLMQHFLEVGFPGKRQEAWRYTDLALLAEADYAPADGGAVDAVHLPRLPGCDRLVFVNGRYQSAHSDGPAPAPLPLPEQTFDGVTALNAALSADGLNLVLQRSERLPQPLHVVIDHRAARAGMAHLRHRIMLGEHAEAEVILHCTGEGRYFSTQALDVQLGAGARLKLHRLQEDSADATGLSRVDATLARDAQLDADAVELGGGLIRHDFNVVLNGPGSAVNLNGLYVPVGHSHIDTHTRIEHRAPRGRSRELFRGIAAGHGHGVFDGLVVVGKGAVKTDSEQRVANLLLSDKAEIDAKPELEIYNDDVRCSHGATTGQLDETALFYLRSRGIDRLAAQRLLIRAFALSALESIALPALRQWVEQRLDLHLRTALSEEIAP